MLQASPLPTDVCVGLLADRIGADNPTDEDADDGWRMGIVAASSVADGIRGHPQ